MEAGLGEWFEWELGGWEAGGAGGGDDDGGDVTGDDGTPGDEDPGGTGAGAEAGGMPSWQRGRGLMVRPSLERGSAYLFVGQEAPEGGLVLWWRAEDGGEEGRAALDGGWARLRVLCEETTVYVYAAAEDVDGEAAGPGTDYGWTPLAAVDLPIAARALAGEYAGEGQGAAGELSRGWAPARQVKIIAAAEGAREGLWEEDGDGGLWGIGEGSVLLGTDLAPGRHELYARWDPGAAGVLDFSWGAVDGGASGGVAGVAQAGRAGVWLALGALGLAPAGAGEDADAEVVPELDGGGDGDGDGGGETTGAWLLAAVGDVGLPSHLGGLHLARVEDGPWAPGETDAGGTEGAAEGSPGAGGGGTGAGGGGGTDDGGAGGAEDIEGVAEEGGTGQEGGAFVAGRELYVDVVEGGDWLSGRARQRTGGGEHGPKRTVAGALEAAVQGDVIVLAEGQAAHRAGAIDLSGTGAGMRLDGGLDLSGPPPSPAP